MIDEECEETYGNVDNRHPGKRRLFFDKEQEVNKVECSVVEQKEPGELPLRLLSWLHRLTAVAEILCGELLQIQYPAPGENPNDDALSPVDPHDIPDVPFERQSEGDGHQIGKDK